MKIDGKTLAQNIKDGVKYEINKLGIKPKFLIIHVVGNDASEIYVNNKIKACEYCGIEVEVYRYANDVTTDRLVRDIKVNQANFDAVMVQLPLPKQVNEYKVINSIDPNKDVDGLTEVNVGRLWEGDDGLFPCTALGVIALLKNANINLVGKCVCIIGRSNLVGKPLIALLQREHCTVISCHSHTVALVQHTINADVVISAIGKPKHFKRHHFKSKQVIIDVGINRDENGKLCGDVDFEDVANWWTTAKITPVPGGVGPMTVAMLMSNILKAYGMQRGLL